VVLRAAQVRAVGVCNYNAGQVEEMHGLLAKHGIPLASNQARTSTAVLGCRHSQLT
jgi:diketogulonate reductase-like aldo/keto reductase